MTVGKTTTLRPPSEGVESVTANDRGIACILAAVLLFSVYNAIAKWLAVDFNPLQIVFFRGLFGLLPVGLILLHDGKGVRQLVSRRPGLQLVRATTGLLSNVCFILSYRSMPLADAVAIGYAAPIFVTALSVPLLSERVGMHRWSAVVVGFLGVVLVARPGSGAFQLAALLAIAGTLAYSICIITTRRLGAVDASVCTMVHSTTFYALASALALPVVWTTPGWGELTLFALLGCVAGCGMYLFVQAYRFAPAATIAPFDYTAMAWAMLFGFLIWGEVPDWNSLAGITVIVASGLYIFRRETLAARAKAAAAAGR